MRTLVLLLCVLLPLTAGAQEEFWCWDADQVLAFVDSSSVRVLHLAALLNCCPDPITYEVEIGDATIFVEENSMSPCDCDCCYNLEMTLEDVPPGEWNLLYRWFDIEIWDWTERVLEITVPDVGQSPGPILGDQRHSECLDVSEVPDPSARRISWGTMKARYQ